MNFLGIDLGSTSIKAAVLDLEHKRIGTMLRRPFPDPIPALPRLHFEVDPAQILAETRAVLSDLLRQAPDCTGLLMCSQMHGFLLTDANGTPLTNVITWQDQRALTPQPNPSQPETTTDAFSHMMAQLNPQERQALGNDLWASRPISVLYWLAQQGKLPPDAHFCALPDWVLWQLTGSAPATDLTHAAASSMLNIETGDWHRAILAKLGLGELVLPPIAARNQIIGIIAPHFGNANPIHCYPPISDQQCALLGANLQPGELSVNISTGSQVSVLSQPRVYGDFQTRPYYDGGHLITNIHIPAGRSLNALMRLLSELAHAEGQTLPHAWDNALRLAEAVDSTDLTVDLSFFAGATGSQGAISQIREDNLSVGHLFHAAFAHMAQNYAAFAVKLSPQRNWQRIVFSGGLALQSALLRRLICQQLALPARLAESGEDVLVGLLAIALYCDGQAQSVQAARQLVG